MRVKTVRHPSESSGRLGYSSGAKHGPWWAGACCVTAFATSGLTGSSNSPSVLKTILTNPAADPIRVALGGGGAQITALEKIPAAAQRMGCSTSQAYREIRSGRIGPLVKLGARASAVPASSVDAWIAARIAEATKGGAR